MSKKLTNEIIDRTLIDLNKKIIRNSDYANVEGCDDSNMEWVCITCNYGSNIEELWKTSWTCIKNGGCPNCAGNLKITTKKFIEKAKLIHKNTYDYSKSVYGKNNREKIIIICKKHGVFNQIPHSHLNGYGCKKCGTENVANKLKLTTEEFIAKAKEKHNNKYNYTLITKIINVFTHVIIICKKHGLFNQTPSNHLNGYGCKKCGTESVANKLKLTTEEFIKKAEVVHKNKYDYSKTVYGPNNREEVIIICEKHGDFEQTPNDHLNGYGCSLCSPCKKINEKLIKKFLKDNNIEIEKKFKIKLPINLHKKYTYPDFYIPSLNLIIEYNGEHHYKPIRYYSISKEKAEENFIRWQIRDKQLRQYCKENNINLLEIDGREYKGIKINAFLIKYFKDNFNIDSLGLTK